ncbi:hypothetical protein BXY51_004422 [Actinoplanes cyaneus]|nr:hypothetical protein [Actinoplanes cyaneus]
MGDPIRWIDALLDGGHEERAFVELLDLLHREQLVEGFDGPATRIKARERRRALAIAMLASAHVTERYGSPSSHPYLGVATTVVRLADGDQHLEDAALRKVLEHSPEAWRETPYRVGVVVAALAEAHRGEPAYLDHLAGLLAGDDRRHLAFAAPLLGPLGLDETLRLCGTVADEAGEALTAAYADAGRFDDALALAVTLGAGARQPALLRLAGPDLSAAQGKALVAAYRKCPKVSRQRIDQLIYRGRRICLLLALDRVDEAMAELVQQPDCHGTEYGPAQLTVKILRRFADRPAEATPARLRTLLDVLAGDHVIAQELDDVVIDAVRLVHRLGDAAIRTELATTDVPRMRARLRHWQAAADVALAWARVDAGDHTAADSLFAAPAGRSNRAVLRSLLTMAPRTRLASRNPDLFSDLLAAAFRTGTRIPYEEFGADEMRLVPGTLAAAPHPFPRWMGSWVSAYAAGTGDRTLLAFAVAIAPDAQAVWWVGRDVAVFLARAGELAGATEIAELCELIVTKR